MNTPNNKRRRESRDRIENALITLLQNRELNKISITEICSLAEVNRTTFYANYLDIYDLADAVQERLLHDVMNLYREEIEQKRSSHDFLRLFYHIKENPLVYKTYFKLNTDGKLPFMRYSLEEAFSQFDNQYMDYHIVFFANGLNAVIKKWLDNNCRETPEEIMSIIRAEYRISEHA